jgi:hypothetical protein
MLEAIQPQVAEVRVVRLPHILPQENTAVAVFLEPHLAPLVQFASYGVWVDYSHQLIQHLFRQ